MFHVDNIPHVAGVSTPVRTLVWSFSLATALFCQTKNYELARQAIAAGRPTEAAAIFRELARADPGNAGLQLNLSIAEYKSGNFSQAAESAAAALKLNPDLLPACLFLGASDVELGRFASALPPLERFVSATPDDRNGRLMLGEALLGAARPADALEHLEIASRPAIENPRLSYDLWRAYTALDRTADALAAARRLASAPPSFESHLYSGKLQESEHRWREAAAQFQEALKLRPDDKGVLLEYAWSLFRSRDYETALSVLKPCLSAQQSAQIQFLYGAALLNLQQPAEAIPYLRAALAADPALVPARAALGQAYMQAGKPADAVPQLEQAVSGDEDGTVHFQLFRAYQLTNRPEDAKQALTAYQHFRESHATSP